MLEQEIKILFEKPQIQPNYLSHEEDRRVLLAGIKISRRLMNTEALAPYFDYEGYPGAHVQKDDELLDVARQRSTTLSFDGHLPNGNKD